MFVKPLVISLFFAITLRSTANEAYFIPDPETIGHWQFDGNLNDSSPSGLSAKSTNANFTDSTFGQALIASADISVVDDENVFEKIEQGFTIKVLFKLESVSETVQALVWKRSTEPNRGFSLQILDRKPLFSFYDTEGQHCYLYGPPLQESDLNQWINLTVSFDGTRLKMYINDNIMGTATFENAVMDIGDGALFFGSAGPNRILKGKIDEVLITATKRNKKRPVFTFIPDALFFDFGAPYLDPFSGFERVDVDTMYNDQNKFGWTFLGKRGETSQPLFQREPKTQLAYPDNLTGTAIHFRGGKENLKFNADVESGDYVVVLYLNAFADGGRVFNSSPYHVYANGEKKVAREVTKASFKKMFYREFSDEFEWKPGDDIWNKYLKDEVNIYKFPVTVKEGKLELEFEVSPLTSDGSTEVSGLLSLNGLIVVPEKAKDDLDRVLIDIEKERRRQFFVRCKEEIIPETNELPELSATIRELGYVPFSRYYMRQVFHNTVPLKSEIEAAPNFFAAQGQRQIATFSLYPLQNLEDVEISIDTLHSETGSEISAKQMNIFRVRYIEEPVDYRKIDDFSYLPLGKLLMPNTPFTIEKGVTRRYLLEVNTPDDAVPGDYSGTITIKPKNAREYKLKFAFKVYPFKLESYADDDERIWIYRPWSTLSWNGDLLWTEESKWGRIRDDVAVMKKYLIAPTIGFDWFMTDEDLKAFMDIYQQHNFRGFASYGSYSLLGIVDKIHKTPGEHGDYSEYITRIKEVEALRKKYNWPKFAYYTTAEIHNGMPGYLEGKWAIEQLKKAAPEAPLFCLPNRMEEFEVMIDSEVDIIGPNAVSMREEVTEEIKNAGKKLWFYGWGRERFRCGLIDWRLENRGGLKEWWTAGSQKPFNPYDTTRFFDTWNDAPPYEGPDGVIPTLGLEETTAGRIDFLYLATLDLWIERAAKVKSPAAQKAVLEASQFVTELKNRIKPDYYFYYRKNKELRATGIGRLDYRNKEEVFNWPVEDYRNVRLQAAELIVTLKKASNQF